MPDIKIVHINETRDARARQTDIADLENVQAQIILKINEVLAAVAQLRADCDAIMGKSEARH